LKSETNFSFVIHIVATRLQNGLPPPTNSTGLCSVQSENETAEVDDYVIRILAICRGGIDRR
jgi:hypothetical protein